MSPTRPRTLLLAALAGLALGLLFGRTGYEQLPPLPAYAPLTLVLLAVFELGLARTVRLRVGGRPSPRGPMHPLEVARAAALAKASSPTGALLAGAWTGLGLHLLPLAVPQARQDLLVTAVAAAASLLLVAAALLLERACRTPERDDDAPAGPVGGTS